MLSNVLARMLAGNALLRDAKFVMPGLVPGIHVLLHLRKKDVDARDEARP
jgi:hypothetical protein